ncbi:MAG: gliding motility lipoprotein GldH [Chitinophagales bacterium]|nr:gliding motility lipoprotein GldH [Chitinophagales bacterium]
MKKLFYLLPLTLLAACGPSYVYDETQTPPAQGWGYADTLRYSFNISDTSAVYTMHLDFKHAADYKFQNLYLNLDTYLPDGKKLHKLRSFEFFNTEGKPYGKVEGKAFVANNVLQEYAKFPQPGQYTLLVSQFTRTEQLQGVQGVSLRIGKVERK